MENEVILQKLYNYSGKLAVYCQGHTYESFSANTKLAEACAVSLGQMGALCRGLDPAFTAQHPEIPWRKMNGLRDRILHDDDGVNLRLVWEVVSEDIPALRDALQNIL